MPHYLPTNGKNLVCDERLAKFDFSIDDILHARLKTLGQSFFTERCHGN